MTRNLPPPALGEFERLSIIGGSGGAQDAVGGLPGVSPLAVDRGRRSRCDHVPGTNGDTASTASAE